MFGNLERKAKNIKQTFIFKIDENEKNNFGNIIRKGKNVLIEICVKYLWLKIDKGGKQILNLKTEKLKMCHNWDFK